MDLPQVARLASRPIFAATGGTLPFACLVLAALVAVGAPQVQEKEYCITENFEVKCKPGRVILMHTAKFGRIKLGRCVTRNFGHLGCSRDVLLQLDARCSGRHSCEMSVSDPDLVRTEPCPLDFSSYLLASYECVKVSPTPTEWCGSQNYIRLTEPVGYIASVTTEETGCGSITSPWVITAAPGQRVNITLYDFSLTGHNDSSRASGGQRSSVPIYCQQYARLEERGASRSTIICGGEQRERHVYTSVTYEVEIHIMSRRLLGKNAYFILKYEAVGCPNMKPPQDTYIRRDGNKLFVICNHTGEMSQLTCVGRTWQGDIRNCTPVSPIHVEEMTGGVGLPPVGISVVIIVGVAMVVVVYVAIMIICVMYLQRRRRRLRRQAEDKGDTAHTPLADIQLLKAGDSNEGLEERVPMLAKSGMRGPGGVGCVSVGEYTDVHMRQLLQSQGGITAESHYMDRDALARAAVAAAASMNDDQKCDCYATYARRPFPRIRDSIYEPTSRLHKVQCPTVPNGAKAYFELDPKGLNSGGNLPGPDVVAGSGGNMGREAQSDTSESENEVNRLREQAL